MDAADRHDGWYPHVTVAAIARRDGKYLMVRERILGRPVINQPAGHLEKDETLQEAVIRECREETGWEFEPEGLVGIYYMQNRHGTSYLRFAFHGTLSGHVDACRLDPEIEEVVWLDRDTLAQNRSHHRNEMVLQCIDDFESGKRLPNDAILQSIQAG